MKKIITLFLSTIYLIIVIFSTLYILKLNKYNVSEFGNYSFFKIENNLIITNKRQKINTSDKVFYYDTYSKNVSIKEQKVIKIEKINNIETIYTLESKHLLSNRYLLGNSNCIIISHLGTVISIITSTLGYLLFIVLPILFILIYFIHNLRIELKNKKCGVINEESIKK